MQGPRVLTSAMAALAVLAFTAGDARAQEADTAAGVAGSPSEADFEWSVTHDLDTLDADHGSPAGLWSDGETLWVTESGPARDAAVYAYDLATGRRAAEAELGLDASNRTPRGLWSDGEVMWVADGDRDLLYAYGPGSGGRASQHDIALDPRNGDAHGLWSSGGVMWVVDGAAGALFAYDLETGGLLAERALAEENGTPRGIWSDGVGLWVSDHAAGRLFAYRLPAAGEGSGGEDAGAGALERVPGEDFTGLAAASNDSPRGIWSDGAVMYVADGDDARVYSYNMPGAWDARLASLELSRVDFGEFSPLREDYAAETIPDGNIATLRATAAQPDASLAVEPADHDGDPGNGRQLRLIPGLEITVTVTSPDGSRERVYRLRLGEEEGDLAAAGCLRGAVDVGVSLLTYAGGSVEELGSCAGGRHVTALFATHGGSFVAYIVGAPAFVNRGFQTLYAAGLPPGTPLIARSDGPASAAPPGGPAEPPWPECLRGEVAAGFSLLRYEDGSLEGIEPCAGERNITALYATSGGAFVAYIVGAPAFVNRDFAELYADGIPRGAYLLAKSDGSPGGQTEGR